MAKAIVTPSWNWKPYAGLLCIAIIAYWPISLQLFSIKNDNIVVFLAFRFNISEAIQQGHLPLWTPYMNLGFPMHADMQSGVWNPVIWFFSLFGRYTVTAMHIETLLYIFIAGAGMFRLCKAFISDNTIAFALAVSYMFCGYMCDVAGNNILFVAGAAFVPVTIYYGYALFKKTNYKNTIKLAFALYFLFSASYPFFFVVTAYVIGASFIFLWIRCLIQKRNKEALYIFKVYHTSAVIFLLIASPAIYSYIGLLTEYSRGNDISLARANENRLTFKSLSSFILPQSSLKNANISADLTMRNAYVGLLPILLMIVWMIQNKTTRKEWLLIAMCILGLLYATGSLTPFHSFIYHFLPLMDHFRHPANARVFLTIPLLLFAAIIIQKWKADRRFITNLRIIAAIFIICLMIYFCFQPVSFYKDAWTPFTDFSFSSRASIKQLFNSLSNASYIFTNGVVQCISLMALLIIPKKLFWKFVLPLAIINGFIFLQFSLPVTSVSKLSPQTINAALSKSPNGYPILSYKSSIAENTISDSNSFAIIGHANFYNKQIGFPTVNYNPTILHATEKLLSDSVTLNKVLHSPVASVIINTEDIQNDKHLIFEPLAISSMNNNSFSFDCQFNEPVQLKLIQTYIEGWSAYVDDKKQPVSIADIAFMQVAVPEGKHVVTFQYMPKWIIWLIALSLFTQLFCIFYLLKRSRS